MAKTKAEQRNQDQLAEIARLKDDYIRYSRPPHLSHGRLFYRSGRGYVADLAQRRPGIRGKIRRAKATWALKKIQATRDTSSCWSAS
jgi:hypothetical protein